MGRNLGPGLVSTLSQTGAWYERGFEIPGLRTSVPQWDLPRSLHPHHGGQCDQLVQLLDQCEVRGTEACRTLSKLGGRGHAAAGAPAWSARRVKGPEGWRTGDRRAGQGWGAPGGESKAPTAAVLMAALRLWAYLLKAACLLDGNTKYLREKAC